MYVTEDTITQIAVDRWSTAKNPRLAEIMTALVRHVHGFAREVQLTEGEWIEAMGWLTKTLARSPTTSGWSSSWRPT